jgi:hypothetical protein
MDLYRRTQLVRQVEDAISYAWMVLKTADAKSALDETYVADYGIENETERVAVLGTWEPTRGPTVNNEGKLVGGYTYSDTTLPDLAKKLQDMGVILKTHSTHAYNNSLKKLYKI